MPGLLILSSRISLLPIFHLRSCSGFCTISPTIVCITPIFPSVPNQSQKGLHGCSSESDYILRSPPNNLPAKATQKLGANPTTTIDSIVPVHPTSKTGFRPIRSERQPQNMPVKLSAKLKAEMKRPA